MREMEMERERTDENVGGNTKRRGRKKEKGRDDYRLRCTGIERPRNGEKEGRREEHEDQGNNGTKCREMIRKIKIRGKNRKPVK